MYNNYIYTDTNYIYHYIILYIRHNTYLSNVLWMIKVLNSKRCYFSVRQQDRRDCNSSLILRQGLVREGGKQTKIIYIYIYIYIYM